MVKKNDENVWGNDSHLRSVNWWRRHDLPTPMSPMMMYLKINSYGNDIAAVSLWWLVFLCCGKKNESKKGEFKKESNHSLRKRKSKEKERSSNAAELTHASREVMTK